MPALIKGVANELLNRYNPTGVANLIPAQLIYSIVNYSTLCKEFRRFLRSEFSWMEMRFGYIHAI